MLIAGFPVIERHRHTIPVGYVPYDKDAATYEDIKD
ncbi:VanW family protein [Peptococcaceae bacterium]|nr:VanW family protein [Peptococcaceae bacterium]